MAWTTYQTLDTPAEISAIQYTGTNVATVVATLNDPKVSYEIVDNDTIMLAIPRWKEGIRRQHRMNVNDWLIETGVADPPYLIVTDALFQAWFETP